MSILAKGKHQFLPRDQVFLITLSLETVIMTTQKISIATVFIRISAQPRISAHLE